MQRGLPFAGHARGSVILQGPAREILTSVNVYVGQIPASVDDAFVKLLLDQCGIVMSWKRVKDPSTGTLRNFGYVRYADPNGALRALRLLHELPIDEGHKLMVRVDSNTRKKLDDYIESVKAPLAKVMNMDVGDDLLTKDDDVKRAVIRKLLEDRKLGRAVVPDNSLISQRDARLAESTASLEKAMEEAEEVDDAQRELHAFLQRVRKTKGPSDDMRPDRRGSRDRSFERNPSSERKRSLPRQDSSRDRSSERKRSRQRDSRPEAPPAEQPHPCSPNKLMAIPVESRAPAPQTSSITTEKPLPQKLGFTLKAKVNKAGRNRKTLNPAAIFGGTIEVDAAKSDGGNTDQKLEVPSDLDGLYNFPMDWVKIDIAGIVPGRFKTWLSAEIATYLGGQEDEVVVDFMIDQLESHVDATKFEEAIASIFGEETKDMMANVWKRLAQESATM